VVKKKDKIKFVKTGGQTERGIGREARIFLVITQDGMRSRKVWKPGQPGKGGGRL